MAITLNGTTGITTPAIDNQGNLTVDGGTIKLDGNYPVGTGNVALGDAALDSNVSGASNVAIGADTLTANTTSYNTAVGYQAAYSNTTGYDLVSLGSAALFNNTTALENTAIGRSAYYTNTTGAYGTALGAYALFSNTTGSYNTALGDRSLFSNTTASQNTAVGYQAGYSNTTGQRMSAFGYNAADANTTGTDTVAFGRNALTSNTVGTGNTAFGTHALYSTTSDNYNTAIGSFSMESTTGGSNTCVGYESGHAITSGSKNTIIGRYSGNQGGLDIRTLNNIIVLSDGDGNPRVHIDTANAVLIGTGFATTGGSSGIKINADGAGIQTKAGSTGFHYHNRFYNSNGQVGYISTQNSGTVYNTSSDYRLKENVSYTWDATTRLKQLKPARFNFIADGTDVVVDGFLAHEAQAVVPECVTGAKDAVDADGNPEYQGIDQSKLVPLLVKTIQELEARITALEGA